MTRDHYSGRRENYDDLLEREIAVKSLEVIQLGVERRSREGKKIIVSIRVLSFIGWIVDEAGAPTKPSVVS